MISIGTRYSYTLTGFYGGLFTLGQDTAAALRADVLRRFRDDTGLSLISFQLESGETFGAYVTTRFPYNARVTVQTRIAYARSEDVVAVVKGVFWRASDHEPLFEAAMLPQIGFPSLAGLNLSLGLIAVIVVASVVGVMALKP